MISPLLLSIEPNQQFDVCEGADYRSGDIHLPYKQRPGGASSFQSGDSNGIWKWVAGLLVLIAAIVLAFFLLGGDADADAGN